MSSESSLTPATGAGAALAIVREYLGRSDARIRRHAMTALAALETPKAIDQLVHQTRQDPEPAVRCHGIDELISATAESALQPAYEAVHTLAVGDPDEQVRRHAVHRLAERNPRAPQTLGLVHRAAIEDPSPLVRRGAVDWLAAMNRPEAAEVLAQVAVIERDPESRRHAEAKLHSTEPTALRSAISGLWKSLQPSGSGGPAAYALLGRLANGGQEVPAPPGNWWQRWVRSLSVPSLPDPDRPARWPWSAWWWGAFATTFAVLFAAAFLALRSSAAGNQPGVAVIFLMTVAIALVLFAGGKPTPYGLHYDRRIAWWSRMTGTTARAVLLTLGLAGVVSLALISHPAEIFQWPVLVFVALATLSVALTASSARAGSFLAFHGFGAGRGRRFWQVLVGSASAALVLLTFRLLWRLISSDPQAPLDVLGLAILVLFLPIAFGLSIVTAVTDGPASGSGSGWRRMVCFGLVGVAALWLIPSMGGISRQGWLWSSPKAVEHESLSFSTPFNQGPTRQPFEVDFLQRVRVEIEEDEFDPSDTLFRILDEDGDTVAMADDPPSGEFWIGPGEFQIVADLYSYDDYGSSSRTKGLRGWMQDLFAVVWGGSGSLGTIQLVLNSQQDPMEVTAPEADPQLDSPQTHYYRTERNLQRGLFTVDFSQRVTFRVMELTEESLRLDDVFVYLEVRPLGGDAPVAHEAIQSLGVTGDNGLTSLLAAGSYEFCLYRANSLMGALEEQTATGREVCGSGGEADSTRFPQPLHLELATDGEELQVVEGARDLRAADEDETVSAAWSVTETPARWPFEIESGQKVSIQVTQDNNDLVVEIYRDGESIAMGDDPCEISDAILGAGRYEIVVSDYSVGAEAPSNSLETMELLEIQLEAFSDSTPGALEAAAPGEQNEVSFDLFRRPLSLTLTADNPQTIRVVSTQEYTDMVVQVFQDGELLEEGDDPSELSMALDPGTYTVVITEYLVDATSAPTPLTDPESVRIVLEGQ